MSRTRYTKQQEEEDYEILLESGLIGEFNANKNLVKQLAHALIEVKCNAEEEYAKRQIAMNSLFSTAIQMEKERSKPLLQIARERFGKWRTGKDL
jgi:hypothetical protein